MSAQVLVEKVAETSRSSYYRVGKDVTVVAVPCSAGCRLTCLSCRVTGDCKHIRLVEQHMAERMAEAA